jgi:hypothetical protein
MRFKYKSEKIYPINNLKTNSYFISNKRLRSILNELEDSNKKKLLLKYVPMSCNYGVNRLNDVERITNYRSTRKNIKYHISLNGLTRSCNVKVSAKFQNDLNILANKNLTAYEYKI